MTQRELEDKRIKMIVELIEDERDRYNRVLDILEAQDAMDETDMELELSYKEAVVCLDHILHTISIISQWNDVDFEDFEVDK